MRKEWLETDYYALLGVDRDASQKDIKKSFRKLARDFHPDANEGDSSAESKFKEVNEAYDVLGNEDSRKEYDHARDMGYFVGGPGWHPATGSRRGPFRRDRCRRGVRLSTVFSGQRLSDLFGQPLNRRQAGRDVAADLQLSFHDAIAGVTKQVNIDGNTFKVKIPKGIDDGTRIRLKGRGGPGMRGGPPGDAYVTVRVPNHPLFARSGRNLRLSVPITFAEAALGAEIEVPTLDGSVRLRIPAGTKTGKTFRVSGRGVETAKERGDLLVSVEVTVPKDLTDEQRALLEKFRDNGPDDNPRAHLGV